MTDTTQSEFNMAVSYLNRMNWLFYRCDEASMNLDPFGWFHSLMAIYREISTELTDDEKQKYEGDPEDPTDGIIDQLNRDIIQNHRRGQGTQVDPKLYIRLHNFDMFVRTVLKRAGLLTKMKDDFLEPLLW